MLVSWFLLVKILFWRWIEGLYLIAELPVNLDDGNEFNRYILELANPTRHCTSAFGSVGF